MKKLRLRLYVRDFFHRMKFKRTAPLRGRYEISDWRETIDRIIAGNRSICRYGDGELRMVMQYLGYTKAKSGFQVYDETLGQRLYQILNDPQPDNCIIALPHCMFEKEISHMKIESRYFWEKFTNKWFKRMAETVLKPGVPYGDATITRAYNCLKDKTQSHERFSALKALWNNRNLLIIEGSQTRMGVGNDLYSNAASIRRILVPATNAFSRYDEILQATLSAFTPPDLIIIAAGMTATVLAYDLARHGCQALDLGHLDIEYEWSLRGATSRVKVPGKFTNESSDKSPDTGCSDKDYLASIIARIE